MSLGPNGANRMCLLRKIQMRLRGINFCTSSAHFALSFVRQPNGPKCIQIVRNTSKHEFRVQWGGSGALVAKNSDTTSWHELLHQLGPFCTEFCNTTKRSQMHQNSMKRYETWVFGPMGWIGCLTRLHGTNFCTTSARFAPSFVRQPNSTKCTQILQNAPKHEFRSQRGQLGVFVAKNYDATSCQELLCQFSPFCPEFCKAMKRSQMRPNSTKCTETWG